MMELLYVEIPVKGCLGRSLFFSSSNIHLSFCKYFTLDFHRNLSCLVNNLFLPPWWPRVLSACEGSMVRSLVRIHAAVRFFRKMRKKNHFGDNFIDLAKILANKNRILNFCITSINSHLSRPPQR